MRRYVLLAPIDGTNKAARRGTGTRDPDAVRPVRLVPDLQTASIRASSFPICFLHLLLPLPYVATVSTHLFSL